LGSVAYGLSSTTFQPLVWVTDQGNFRVQAFDTAGNFVSTFGSVGAQNGQFSDPGGIAYERHFTAGNPNANLLFVTDRDRVQVFDTSGGFVTKFGLPAPGGSPGPGTFAQTSGISVPVNFPLDQTIYVTDRGSNTVQQFVTMNDEDNDGILDVIDTDPSNFSNDFKDAAGNTGTIIDRGDQLGLNFVIGPDLFKGFQGRIRVTTDPLGGPKPLVIQECGTPVLGEINAGGSVLLKCGSATTMVEAGTATVRYLVSAATTVTANLAAGQGLKVDPTTATLTAVAGPVVIQINGVAVTLGAGQSTTIPPAVKASISTPVGGATFQTDFDLKLFVKSERELFEGTEFVPRVAIKPDKSVPVDVTVTYADTGGAGNGTITLADNGAVVRTVNVPGAQGTGTATFGGNLGSGAHSLVASVTISNSGGSSTATTTPVTVTVSDGVSSLDALRFDLTGVTNLRYDGKLRYEVLSGRRELADGNLGASSGSFTSLPLPRAVAGGETLCLKETILGHVGHVGSTSLAVDATANGDHHVKTVTLKSHGESGERACRDVW
jgi:hypothetical protein